MLLFVIADHMAKAAGSEMNIGTAEGFEVNFFAGNSFDDVRTGQEHVDCLRTMMIRSVTAGE